MGTGWTSRARPMYPRELCTPKVRLLPFDVVSSQRPLIADVEHAAADHRMRPAWKTLILNAESAFLFVPCGARFREANDVVFALDVQIAVRVHQRAFAHAAVAPHHFAGGELEAGQDRVVEPVEVPVHQDDAAVMVLHVAGEGDLL